MGVLSMHGQTRNIQASEFKTQLVRGLLVQRTDAKTHNFSPVGQCSSFEIGTQICK